MGIVLPRHWAGSRAATRPASGARRRSARTVELLGALRGYLAPDVELSVLDRFTKLSRIRIRLIECGLNLIDIVGGGAQQFIGVLLALREGAPFFDKVVHMPIQRLMGDRLIGGGQFVEHRVEALFDILCRRHSAKLVSQHPAD